MTVWAEFRPPKTPTNPTPALTDPDTLTLRILNPSGIVTDLLYPAGVEKVSTGTYRSVITLDQPGLWDWEWIATGTGTTVTQRCGPIRVDAGIAAP